MSRPAAFLDRDGTIIHDANYIREPAQVATVPGATAAIRRLNDADIPVIVVTNQSGIARGWLTTDDYEAVQARMAALLENESGARIDASYMCPHHPDLTGPCDCRKPGSLLFRRAAADHDLDLSRSAYIGDRWRDAAPAIELGGLGVVIIGPTTPTEDRERLAEQSAILTTGSLGEAAERFLATLPGPVVRP